jgi:hypothetical protein
LISFITPIAILIGGALLPKNVARFLGALVLLVLVFFGYVLYLELNPIPLPNRDPGTIDPRSELPPCRGGLTNNQCPQRKMMHLAGYTCGRVPIGDECMAQLAQRVPAVEDCHRIEKFFPSPHYGDCLKHFGVDSVVDAEYAQICARALQKGDVDALTSANCPKPREPGQK